MRRYIPQSLPGRGLSVGVAVRVAVAIVGALAGQLPQFFAIVDTIAGIAIAVGAVYYVFKLLALAKRRLLWRVRRKLIVSYIFVGFVPALLIVAFFLLCGYLLFYNISSYLVQSQLRGLADRARLIAQTAALDIQRAGGRDMTGIVARREARDAPQHADLSIVAVPAAQTCENAAPSTLKLDATDFRGAKAGSWKHVAPPVDVPGWIPCGGFSGLFAYSHHKVPHNEPADADDDQDTHLFVRAVALPEAARPAYAVIVDLPVNEQARSARGNEPGIDTTSVTPVPRPDEEPPARGRDGGDAAAPPRAEVTGWLKWFPPAVIEYRDWASGKIGTVNVRMLPNLPELYQRLSTSQAAVGRSVGGGLLITLFIIGVLFLVIEFMAAIAGFMLAKSITGSVPRLFMGTERVRQGDFTHKIAVRSQEQLGELAGSFNLMTASIEDLLLQAAEQKRLADEPPLPHHIPMP